jgi:hypothetical protein
VSRQKETASLTLDIAERYTAPHGPAAPRHLWGRENENLSTLIILITFRIFSFRPRFEPVGDAPAPMLSLVVL